MKGVHKLSNLVKAIKKFEKMLKEFPDDRKHTYEFYFFFKSLPSVRSDSIPFVELGSILKNKKPEIFHELRRFSKQNYVIDTITHVEMDLQEAINTINKIIN